MYLPKLHVRNCTTSSCYRTYPKDLHRKQCKILGVTAHVLRHYTTFFEHEKLVDSLVGENKELKNALYLKYADKIKNKLDNEKLESLKELKEKQGDLSKEDPLPEAVELMERIRNKANKMEEKSKAFEDEPKKKTSLPRDTGLPPTVKTLSDFMKLDMIKDEDPKFISELWKSHHRKKNDCIYAVIPSKFYKTMRNRARECPSFLYPVPRGDNGEVEFVYSEFSGNQCIFSTLLEVQKNKENARPSLTINHYTDLAKTKNIVLMHGEVDAARLKVHEAQFVANLFRTFYLDDEVKYYHFVEGFNKRPQEFKYQDLIEAVQTLPEEISKRSLEDWF